MRYRILTWYAFHLPSRAWMALPNDWRRWWAQEWMNRFMEAKRAGVLGPSTRERQ